MPTRQITVILIFSLFLFLTQLSAFEQTAKNKCNTKCSAEYGKCVNICKNKDKCVEKCSVKVKKCRINCK